MTSETSRTQQDVTVDFPRLSWRFLTSFFLGYHGDLRVQIFLDPSARQAHAFSPRRHASSPADRDVGQCAPPCNPPRGQFPTPGEAKRSNSPWSPGGGGGGGTPGPATDRCISIGSAETNPDFIKFKSYQAIETNTTYPQIQPRHPILSLSLSLSLSLPFSQFLSLLVTVRIFSLSFFLLFSLSVSLSLSLSIFLSI